MHMYVLTPGLCWLIAAYSGEQPVDVDPPPLPISPDSSHCLQYTIQKLYISGNSTRALQYSIDNSDLREKVFSEL